MQRAELGFEVPRVHDEEAIGPVARGVRGNIPRSRPDPLHDLTAERAELGHEPRNLPVLEPSPERSCVLSDGDGCPPAECPVGVCAQTRGQLYRSGPNRKKF